MGEQFGFVNQVTSFDQVLSNDQIDIVDICTPPFLHKEMIIKALNAGKNVVCEKPLTGYFGKAGDPKPIGLKVPKSQMYQAVIRELDQIKAAVEKAPGFLAYAENFIYAPAISKTAELLKAKNSRILFMKGEESLRGSSSVLAGQWDKNGGGSLMRVGSHPLGGILYLKQAEADYRGQAIEITSVTADMGQITKHLDDSELKYHTIRIQDVEDFANVTITFSDGSKAVVLASDTVLGGSKNYVEVYANTGSFINNLTPIDTLNAYMLDDQGLDGVTFSEMLPTAVGWNKAFVADDVIRGYVDELQDFANCAAEGRQPRSHFQIAYNITKVMYAAYYSAEENRTITFN